MLNTDTQRERQNASAHTHAYVSTPFTHKKKDNVIQYLAHKRHNIILGTQNTNTAQTWRKHAHTSTCTSHTPCTLLNAKKVVTSRPTNPQTPATLPSLPQRQRSTCLPHFFPMANTMPPPLCTSIDKRSCRRPPGALPAPINNIYYYSAATLTRKRLILQYTQQCNEREERVNPWKGAPSSVSSEQLSRPSP